MKTSHTPGPWIAVEEEKPRGLEFHVNPHNGFCLTTLKTGKDPSHIAITRANARLIAKAPENEEVRLELLSIFRGFVSDDFTAFLENEHGRSFVREALAKIGPTTPQTFLALIKKAALLAGLEE